MLEIIGGLSFFWESRKLSHWSRKDERQIASNRVGSSLRKNGLLMNREEDNFFGEDTKSLSRFLLYEEKAVVAL